MVLPILSDPQHLTSAHAALGAFARYPAAMLYVGPDQIMPVTSALSAIVGILLMFWSRIVGFTVRTWSSLTGRSRSTELPSSEVQSTK